jgi:hypothetical protein
MSVIGMKPEVDPANMIIAAQLGLDWPERHCARDELKEVSSVKVVLIEEPCFGPANNRCLYLGEEVLQVCTDAFEI